MILGSNKSKNMKNTQVPKLTLNVVNELLLRSYVHLKIFKKLRNKITNIWWLKKYSGLVALKNRIQAFNQELWGFTMICFYMCF